MKSIKLLTEGRCTGCGKPIELTYEIRHESSFPMEMVSTGSRPPTEIHLKHEFSCSSCGALYTPKKGNGLRLHGHQAVIDLLSNYSEVTLRRNVPAHHVVAEDTLSWGIPKTSVLVKMNPPQSSRRLPDHASLKDDDRFFILPGLPEKNATLFDVQRAWESEAEKRFAEVKKQVLALFHAGAKVKARKLAREYNMEFILGPSESGLKFLREIQATPQTELTVNSARLRRCYKKLVSLPKPPKEAVGAEQVWVVNQHDLSLITCWVPVSYLT